MRAFRHSSGVHLGAATIEDMARKDEAEFWLATITLVVIVIGVLVVLARLVGVA